MAEDSKGKLSVDDAKTWSGHRLDEVGGNAVGKIEGVYVDEKTGEPEWLQARMGRFGHHSLVPARDAVEGIDRVWVPYSRDEIRKAPRIDPGVSIARDQEKEFLAHYGIDTEIAGRGAELADRGPAETTIRPA
ncbi:hypothetical protein BH10ACT11_BH10ACT11_08230 [soil metagenome]